LAQEKIGVKNPETFVSKRMKKKIGAKKGGNPDFLGDNKILM